MWRSGEGTAPYRCLMIPTNPNLKPQQKPRSKEFPYFSVFFIQNSYSVFSLQPMIARIFACSVSAYSTVRAMPSVTRIRDSSEARAAR